MKRAISILVAVCFYHGTSLVCVAQRLIPVIRLSADETAKAKQLGQNLSDARERRAKAKLSWDQFNKSYQAAHPDLPDLRFTEDFRLAFALSKSADGDIPHAASVELTAEERQKLETLYREMIDSEASALQTETNWREYQYELLLDHLGNSKSGTVMKLATGKEVVVGAPWTGGLAFTPDFRLAFPRIF
jgi:hypothetical protein